jgi:hypothetical protein
MNKFDQLNEWIRDTENSIVNFLSAFSPWLAPLIPAYMTFQHALGTLKFPWFFAFAGSAVVEILGFSAVSTYLSFWFYNRRNKAEGKKAPLTVVIIAFGFYLALIIFSNVLLDTFPSEKWAEIVVRALFTFQTIPAAMLVSVRTQHRELLSEIAKEKRESSESKKKLSETPQKEEIPLSETFRNFPKDWRSLEPNLTYEQTVEIAQLTPTKVREWANGIGVSEKTITNWRSNAQSKLGENNE